ncbi:hypothetical protein BH24ACT10_BH24ACT10_07780 [soil metagenome]
MDLLESGDERDEVPAGARVRRALGWHPPLTAVLALAGVLVAALVGAGLAVREQRAEQARQAVRVEAEVLPERATSSTVRGVARGELVLLVVNQRDVPLRLEGVVVDVPGLEVIDLDVTPGEQLAGGGSRAVSVRFVVQDCSRLSLPGSLTVSLRTEGGPVEQRVLPVLDPDDAREGGVRLGACPDSARSDPPGRPTDLVVRPAGGTSERAGAGASGLALLEVRNGGAQVQLLSVEARVPGVAFDQRRLADGRSLITDEVVVLHLGFRVADCAALEQRGEVVLRVERSGGEQELVLEAVPSPGGAGRLDLRTVLDACG